MGDIHEHHLKNELDILEQKGYRILHIGRRMPDAIVISPENKVIAVEVLSRTKRRDAKGRNKGYRWDGKIEDKRWQFGRFDDILFVLFSLPDDEPMRRILASEHFPDWNEM